jgi:hypothetical protein
MYGRGGAGLTRPRPPHTYAEEPAGACIAAFDTSTHVELWLLKGDALVADVQAEKLDEHDYLLVWGPGRPGLRLVGRSKRCLAFIVAAVQEAVYLTGYPSIVACFLDQSSQSKSSCLTLTCRLTLQSIRAQQPAGESEIMVDMLASLPNGANVQRCSMGSHYLGPALKASDDGVWPTPPVLPVFVRAHDVIRTAVAIQAGVRALYLVLHGDCNGLRR